MNRALIAAIRQVKTRKMENPRNPGHGISFDEAFSAAFDWWRDAGVDQAYLDDPADWLAMPDAPAPAQQEPGQKLGQKPRLQPDNAAPAAPSPGTPSTRPARAFALRTGGTMIDLAAMPADLAAFRDWWMHEPTLDGGRSSGRVMPRGHAGAAVMVIVPEPESDDGDRLLSGPQGRMVDAMLAAMQIPQDDAYMACVLVRHTPTPDWPAITAGGMGEVVARHIALAAPRRIIAFDANNLPLAGNNPAQASAVLRTFNHEGTSIPLLAARALPALLESPRLKQDLWRVWLDWTQ